jgi:iron complex transport system ATP-binding protein
MLTVAGLHHGYGATPVLKGIAPSVAAGEVVSLVGPNGAGKSTLLRCINRILNPAAGVVTIAERPAAEYSRRELARTIAYVPQHSGPALSLPVLDMVWLGRAPHRGHHAAGRDREVVIEVIERLRLEPLVFRLFGELSGGERQRVLIAIHDLALASRFSDRLVMMAGGLVHAHGAWTDVLTPAHLEAVYGVGAVVGTDQGLPYVIPTQRA